jgi:diacylglycerol O-acyltransferase / wax synthase
VRLGPDGDLAMRPYGRTMSEHVSPLDATFLELEEADPSAHMHIGAVMVFDPLPGGGVPAIEAVRELLLERLSAMPRFRQRLSSPRTGGLTWPQWVEDETFDIASHVWRAALPAPGCAAELNEWAAEFWSHRLERTKALWEMVLLEGLKGGRWALVSKTHHCMVDGVGSVDVAHLMLDATPDPAPRAPVTSVAEVSANGGGLAHVPGALLHGARAGLDAVLHPSVLRDATSRGRALAELLLRNEVRAAPHSSLNGPIGKRRRYAHVDVPLDDIKRIKRELGGTVNDVVLAATTGGLRALLEQRGDPLPQAGLRAMVPVNVRGAAEQLALGNRITSLFVSLPVAEESALVRYAMVLEHAERLKAGDQAIAGSTLVQLAGLAPPVLHTFLAQSLFATRLFNVTVTNVPGAQFTLYAFGSPMRQVLGLVPLAAEHAVGIAILSYDGGVTFGINADHDAVPDIDLIARGIEQTLDELLDLAGRRKRGRRRPARAAQR